MNDKLLLVAFDMDGVVLDSEPVHCASVEKLLAELGVPPSGDLTKNVGRSSEEFWGEIIAEHGLRGVTAEAIIDRQYALNMEQFAKSSTPASAGLLELMADIAQHGVTIGLATSSERSFVEAVLAHLGLSGRFRFSVAGTEAARKKPHPDIYLDLLTAAGVPAENAAAIEDSRSGVAAAKAAGLFCIGYQNKTSGEQDLSRADVIVSSLYEVSKILFG